MRAAARAGAAAHGAARRARRPRAAARAEPRVRQARCRSCCCRRTARPATSSTSSRRKQLQQILFEHLQLPVKRKTPTGQPSTAEDVLEELAAGLPAAADRARVPRAGEAQVHLHRQAAGTGERAHRPHPHFLSRRRSRPPGACRRSIRTCRTSRCAVRRGGASARLHRRTRARAAGGRLLADRAAHHGAPVRRCQACGPPSPRTATCTRRRPRRSSASSSSGERRSAPHREDDQLRADLRHVRVRAGAQPGHRARRGRSSTWSATSSATRA